MRTKTYNTDNTTEDDKMECKNKKKHNHKDNRKDSLHGNEHRNGDEHSIRHHDMGHRHENFHTPKVRDFFLASHDKKPKDHHGFFAVPNKCANNKIFNKIK